MIYPFTVYKTEMNKHVFWIAKSLMLKGCVGQGDTQKEALKELEINEKAWIETAKEVGIEVPEVPIIEPSEYSGKITLRFSPSEHKKAAFYAKLEGISLNQYISDAVVKRNSELALLQGATL